jgi:hypothetical protein
MRITAAVTASKGASSELTDLELGHLREDPSEPMLLREPTIKAVLRMA